MSAFFLGVLIFLTQVTFAAELPVEEIAQWVAPGGAHVGDVRTRIFLPKKNAKYPVLLVSGDWSHSARNHRAWDGLSKKMAARGWAVFVIENQDSPQKIQDRKNWKNRALRAGYLVNILPWQISRDARLRERVDTTRLALLGVGEAGGFVALALLGAELQDRQLYGIYSFKDERIGAVIAIRPPGEGQFGMHSASWSHLTATSSAWVVDCGRVQKGKQIFEHWPAGGDGHRAWLLWKNTQCEKDPKIAEAMDSFLRHHFFSTGEKTQKLRSLLPGLSLK